MNKEITAIIVTYNSDKYITDCLNSLALDWPPEYKKQVIVIDNNSQDSTVKVVEKIKGVELYKNLKNVGFARAVNIGIEKSKGDYVLLLNPDTELHKDSMTELVNSMNKNKCGIVGGSAYKPDGIQHGTYVRKPNLLIGLFDFSNLQKLFKNNKWHRFFYYQDVKDTDEDIQVDAVGGGYMLIDREVVNKIGLLDENYFMYLEDIDFCVRANQAGYKVYYCPHSKITHIGGASSNNKEHTNFDAWVRSRMYYFMKHGSLFDNLILQPLFMVDELIMRIKRSI